MSNVNNLHAMLDTLIDKHKDNEYVYGRLFNYIENLLPVALDNSVSLHKQREERRNQLSANRDEFTNRFLHINNYFYSQQTELFLHYDGLHFVIINEDNIHHQILSTITSEKCLRAWKYKVNKNIIKRIKERSPLNAIPEPSTIQFVINVLCPSIFATRNHAKYFLTIIGECIFNKMGDVNLIDNIYIFPKELKEIMREISNQCYSYLGIANIFSNIKYKYYDHNYSACRLFSIDKINKKKHHVPPIITKYMLDFLCVAAHYCDRYGSADNFLKSCNETKLVEHSLFLTSKTPEDIVDTFIEKSLIICATSTIEFKNMIFLWKRFLDERTIPNIIFYENLKNILKKKFSYDEASDSFNGVTSIFLPLVSQFMKFWEANIYESANEMANEMTNESANEMANESANEMANEITSAYENTLEINEIGILFKQSTNKAINCVLEIIQHFYPDVEIKNNKYILNVKCKLWNKYEEIINSFKNYLVEKNNNEIIIEDISILHEAYEYYCLNNKNKYNILASKNYFEKTVLNIMFKPIS
jgi:hypothetical protein